MAGVDNEECKPSPTTPNGYNPQIFVEREKFLANYRCVVCKWIVKDCVEVSCINDGIHKNDLSLLNYDPIWCSTCLQNYLKNYPDVCPITQSKHTKNIQMNGTPNRYIDRQVSRARVKCINGENDEKKDDHEYEIYGLQLEGSARPTIDNGNYKDKRCSWEGILRDYDRHIREECKFVKIECPLNKYFNCCDNYNYNNNSSYINNTNINSKIFKCYISSRMKNDINYLSKHFEICFDNYLNIKNELKQLKQENNSTIEQLKKQLMIEKNRQEQHQHQQQNISNLTNDLIDENTKLKTRIQTLLRNQLIDINKVLVESKDYTKIVKEKYIETIRILDPPDLYPTTVNNAWDCCSKCGKSYAYHYTELANGYTVIYHKDSRWPNYEACEKKHWAWTLERDGKSTYKIWSCSLCDKSSKNLDIMKAHQCPNAINSGKYTTKKIEKWRNVTKIDKKIKRKFDMATQDKTRIEQELRSLCN